MYILKLVNVTDPEFKYFEVVKTTRPVIPCLLPLALKDRCGSLPFGSLASLPAPTRGLPPSRPQPLWLL